MSDTAPGVRVTTGARLHFGLFDTRAPFGGVGMMIDAPSTRVDVWPADAFDPGPTDPDRLTQIAASFQQFATRIPSAPLPQPTPSFPSASPRLRENPNHSVPDPLPPPPLAARHSPLAAQSSPLATREAPLPACRLRVERSAPPHCGLGSGTQLALAAALALARFQGLDHQLSRAELVERIAQRGRRSAIGSLGFFEGGLIWEDGQLRHFGPGDETLRVEPPADWRVVLLRPLEALSPCSGETERRAFETIPPAGTATREQLRALGLQIIESCRGGDFARFAESLTEFNRRSGELFASLQGGPYNGPQVTRLIERVRDAGGTAYGQSSWGSTVFAICPTPKAAEQLAAQLAPTTHHQIAKPKNSGAEMEIEASGELREARG